MIASARQDQMTTQLKFLSRFSEECISSQASSTADESSGRGHSHYISIAANAPPRRTYKSRERMPIESDSTNEGPLSAPVQSSYPNEIYPQSGSTFVPPQRTLSTRGRRLDKAPDNPVAQVWGPSKAWLVRRKNSVSKRQQNDQRKSSSTNRNIFISRFCSSSKEYIDTAVVTVKVRQGRDTAKDEIPSDIMNTYTANEPARAIRSPDDYPQSSPQLDSYPMFGSSRRKPQRAVDDSASNFYNSMSRQPAYGGESSPKIPNSADDTFDSPPRFDSLTRGRRTRKDVQKIIESQPRRYLSPLLNLHETSLPSLHKRQMQELTLLAQPSRKHFKMGHAMDKLPLEAIRPVA
ncbi:hypothetical protein BC829DRAFT_418922 [Chytridium lagenaria]|nr:hypothetical protein BC829DRAFT_418922 [Chytridium lagenaria]